MKFFKGVAASLAAVSMLITVPASAEVGMSQAEKLRRLDIMLMVTGLRCRTTADNFNSEYGRFTTAHLDRRYRPGRIWPRRNPPSPKPKCRA
jgi:hypothetical protein